MLQTCHYLFTKDLEKVLHQPLDKFILLFSALIGQAGHPGLTNDFLIKCRHPWAIMYNDRAVCQNYSLATFFSAVADPELNFMLHLRPEQLNVFRSTCIQIVLKLDLRQHFSELGLFTTKLGSETFPSDSQEDRILMMSVALRVADLSWTCRSLQTYNKWSDKFLEEFFVQGDLEKQIGAGISCFCDRDAVNTSKTNFSFIMVVAMPVITTFTMVLDNKDCQEAMITDGLEKNKAYLLSWTA
jgi:3',5'-cyclic-nucleotide phosphodiesterase/cAMP-specific phosphodiesterase 4